MADALLSPPHILKALNPMREAALLLLFTRRKLKPWEVKQSA